MCASTKNSAACFTLLFKLCSAAGLGGGALKGSSGGGARTRTGEAELLHTKTIRQ